jgi:hypothetical protein
MKSIYIETTIPSYATARQSMNMIVTSKQILTQKFWDEKRNDFQLYISEFVLEECAKGDPDAAQKRLDLIQGITVLPRSEEIIQLAAVYQKILQIPETAKTDCLHLASSVIAKVDYLLSWNCSHLGIVSFKKTLEYNNKNGMKTPLLVTPESFFEFIDPFEEEL